MTSIPDMPLSIHKAERKKAKLRLAIVGPSGSGKTYTSLRIAKGIGGKTLLIDTEAGSGELYGSEFDYDVLPLAPPFTTQKYTEAIKLAESSGYTTIIIDSLSHAWTAEGGILDSVDKLNAGESHSGWRKMSPLHNRLVDTMLQSKLQVIATMRTKTDWVYEKNDQGKIEQRKVGLAPRQREDMEYEFTAVLNVDMNHNGSIGKNRIDALRVFPEGCIPLNEELGALLLEWLEKGKEAIPPCFRCLQKAGEINDSIPGTKEETNYDLCQPCLEAYRRKNPPQPINPPAPAGN